MVPLAGSIVRRALRPRQVILGQQLLLRLLQLLAWLPADGGRCLPNGLKSAIGIRAADARRVGRIDLKPASFAGPVNLYSSASFQRTASVVIPHMVRRTPQRRARLLCRSRGLPPPIPRVRYSRSEPPRSRASLLSPSAISDGRVSTEGHCGQLSAAAFFAP
jgi:hypothetical protein